MYHICWRAVSVSRPQLEQHTKTASYTKQVVCLTGLAVDGTAVRELRSLEQEMREAYARDCKQLGIELNSWRQSCEQDRERREDEMRHWRNSLLSTHLPASESQKEQLQPTSGPSPSAALCEQAPSEELERRQIIGRPSPRAIP